MSVVVVGLSHHTAPVEVRERVAVSAERLEEVLGWLCEAGGLREGVLLSTCNRTEVYADAEDPDRDAARLQQLLADAIKMPLEELSPYLYVRRDEEGVRHLFRVASSLDSMVVGESQILGQIKAAYAAAQALGVAKGASARLMERAFAVAKKVRTDTRIGENPASVGSAAAELAGNIFGDLAGRSVMLVGAGKMGRLTLRHLRAAGVGTVFVANRSAERAEELLAGSAGGFHVPLERILETLERVDIALSSVQMGRFVLDHGEARELLRRRRSRPLFLVDIAVPRSIDPSVNEVENVFLYDIDDLQGVVAQSLASRAAEASRAEKLVENETRAFLDALRQADVAPAIRVLLERFESIRRTELERHLGGRTDLSPELREAVEQATRAMLSKIAHGPIQELKRSASSEDGNASFEALRRALLERQGRGDGK